MTRERGSSRPAVLALAFLGAALMPVGVWVQESGRPLLSSENAPSPQVLDFPPARPEGRNTSEIFDRGGANPGSAAHPFSPGRVRPDAPAVFEMNLRDPEVPDWARGFLEARVPAPWPEVDERFHDAVRLSDDFRSDDFPSIASDPADRDSVWMVWVSYSGRRDELRLAHRDPTDGKWGVWSPVPGVSGDVWRPSLGFDRAGRLWVVWAQQELWAANFDLYGRWFDGETWGRLERLSSQPGGDFNQRLSRAEDGSLHLVWQGFRRGQSDIFHMSFDGSTWSPELRVSESPANDWAPDVAVDSKGSAWVVWDSYDRGNYDIVGRTITDGGLGEIFALTSDDTFEASPSIVVDDRDRVWVAYEEGERGWGKDQGLLIDQAQEPGSTLNLDRRVQVRVREGGSWAAAKPELESLFAPRKAIFEGYFGGSKRPSVSSARLALDDRGRIHLLMRAFESEGGFAQSWRLWVATMSDSGWSKPAIVPFSEGRLSMLADTAPSSDGGLWLTWPRDGFPGFGATLTFPEETVIENVYAARWEPSSPAGFSTGPPQAAPYSHRPPGHADEAGDVARIREWRVRAGGETLQILRGDTHRHTELSLDSRALPDGSVIDFYRYMLDAAAMDFGLITDHQGGADREYWWWLSEKLADLFHAPERYVALFGYERSIQFPMGHRNIIHAERGQLPLPFYQRSRYEGFASVRFHNSAPGVLEDDTRLLHQAIRRSGGITIPHTTATSSGTDWSDNDPQVETLVEIYQGDRHSYEAPGAPLSDVASTPQAATTTPKAAGFVSNAWSKGLRIGVIASSDHFSTHISYAMVWVPERSREALLEAMKARRTYAATDNIVLEFWVGDHFMGDDVTVVGEVPEIRVKAVGTGTIATAEILRNNRVIYSVRPEQSEVALSFRDLEAEPGSNFYYTRVQQRDGQMAWSSPIWVERRAP